ncbi:MAG: Glycosyl transferase, group 1 family protein [Parcubacteria group bacterium GW2011_GWA1_59_11]|nr:MAG: Glycosyl transferase, group 1 family protein [Parcubacteria group bacterium GW2011_GWA1_59_11]
MKIALISLDLTRESADSRIVFSVAKAYEKLGHQVVIYSAEFDPACFPDLYAGMDIRVARLNVPLMSLVGARGFLGKVRERIRRNLLHRKAIARIVDMMDGDFDIVHCHNDASFQLVKRYKQKNPWVRAIWTMNEVPFQRLRQKDLASEMVNILTLAWETILAKRHIKYIDVLVVLDERRRGVAEKLTASVKVLAMPVDYRKFYAPVKDHRTARRVVLMGVGALHPTRRFEDILLAGATLRKQGLNAEVNLVCPDHWKNKEYREYLLEIAEEAGMAGHVRFEFGQLPRDRFHRAYRESDVFVFLNQHKIWGTSPLEAMAGGLPLIAARNTSVAQALEEGKSVLLVDPRRPDQIAERVRTLFETPGLYRKIARKGQEFAKTRTWEDYARNLVQFALEGEVGAKDRSPAFPERGRI